MAKPSRLATGCCFAFFCGLLIGDCRSSPADTLEITVEEYSSKASRNYHRTRHTRERQTLPYKSAASSTTNTLSKEYDSFSLNCPHVADANSDNVRIEVTWTLNDTIWLKIDEGEKKIFNRLTTFTRRVVAGKTVLRVLLNNGRYFFDYDELTGDFAMEIRPVNVYEDAGVWQCHVTVYQRGNTHTLTSRSRVKVPHGHRSHGARHPTSTPRPAYYYLPIFQQIAEREAWSTKKQNKVTSFTRNEHELVQISRDEAIRPKAVVFDRQPQSSQNRHSSHALASIDYEMSIDQPDDDEFYTPRSRVRSAYYSGESPILHSIFTATTVIISLLYVFCS